MKYILSFSIAFLFIGLINVSVETSEIETNDEFENQSELYSAPATITYETIVLRNDNR